MSTPRPPIALLGPQGRVVTAGRMVERLAPTGPVATVTAGWQEREGEDAELNEVLGGRTVNLALYRRADHVWEAEPDLRRAHKELQARLKLLRRSYDMRLARLMDAWSGVEDLEGDQEVLDPERIAALETMRQLDARHVTRVEQLRKDAEFQARVEQHPSYVRHRDEIAHDLRDASVVAIAGGHVAILVNRMRMFGFGELLADKPIVAWSAGAMALTDRIVLFHDTPPQGPGNAEVLDAGLGLASHIVLLPHADRRLRLDDPRRVSRLVRRFRPAECVALDGGEGVERRNGSWVPLTDEDAGLQGARLLQSDGYVAGLAA